MVQRPPRSGAATPGYAPAAPPTSWPSPRRRGAQHHKAVRNRGGAGARAARIAPARPPPAPNRARPRGGPPPRPRPPTSAPVPRRTPPTSGYPRLPRRRGWVARPHRSRAARGAALRRVRLPARRRSAPCSAARWRPRAAACAARRRRRRRGSGAARAGPGRGGRAPGPAPAGRVGRRRTSKLRRTAHSRAVPRRTDRARASVAPVARRTRPRRIAHRPVHPAVPPRSRPPVAPTGRIRRALARRAPRRSQRPRPAPLRCTPVPPRRHRTSRAAALPLADRAPAPPRYQPRPRSGGSVHHYRRNTRAARSGPFPDWRGVRHAV